MLKIRLKRVGRKNDPSFRIVVVDARQGPKSGKAVDLVGSYNPKTKQRLIDGEKAKHWMSVGAQPSDTVYNMLVDEKIIDGKKKNVLPSKSPVVKEEEKEGESKPEGDEAKADAPSEEKPVEEKEEEKPKEDDKPKEEEKSEPEVKKEK